MISYRCLILRANGELSLLDLDDGRERKLTDSVELFWVTCGHSEDKTNLIEEVSWLDYGHRGMQVINCQDVSCVQYVHYCILLGLMLIFYLTSGLFPFYMSENFICACSFSQVWYPSPGADPYKQEDFVQVCV